MKRAAGAVAVAGVVLITLFGVARLWVLSSLAPLGGREPLPGLDDSVLVLWDSLAVPHVVARSDLDFFTTLGYLHARDRLWQLDLLRHAAQGRLSELFGGATIDADRELRELEISVIAAARLERAAPASRRVLEAYARGVNAWLERNPRPLELRLLRHVPEPWEPAQSLAIGVLQAWDLRTTGDEGDLAAVATSLGTARALELLPGPADSDAVIIGAVGEEQERLGGERSETAQHDPRLATRLRPLPAPRSRSWAWDTHGGRSNASNAWAVSGRRTRSGRPILANDPHLTLRAPSIWYLVGAHAPTYQVVGATIPGIPVVVLGHTRRVAWGFTNAMVDDVDLVAEQLSGDSTSYRTPRGWAPVIVVAETIRVRGGQPVVYARRRTEHGPLITTEWRGALDSGRAYALRWLAQDGAGDEVEALRAMAQSRDWTEFQAATERFGSPEQSVVYADTAGRIGYVLAGRVPRRRRGDWPFPSAGWSQAGDPWDGWVDARALPRVLDPASGWIVTANNRLVGPAYPHFVSRHYDVPYRARRIVELLRADTAATAASASRHQMDIVDVFARRFKSLAARAALAAGRADLADRLRGWDGAMDPGALEPTVFWRWYREVALLTFDETPAYHPVWPLHRWLAAGDSPWFDDRKTPGVETLDTIARLAMARVLADRGLLPWGDVHSTVMQHPLARVPLLGWLLGFSVGPLRTGGDDYTVNNSTSLDEGPLFSSSYGPSLRHVVDLGDVAGVGGFILPTGQSGHPLSRHYRDQAARWLNGALWLLPTDPDRVVAVDTLVLVPRR